jgi:diguanylate cyclase (GGDEF)-like protein
MESLFQVLAIQHGDEFAPFRCNAQTLERLVRYFEDVVIENRLHALVIEGRRFASDARRETDRLKKLCRHARRVYLFAEPPATEPPWLPEPIAKLSLINEKQNPPTDAEQFILVLEPRFCGLLVSQPLPTDSALHVKTYEAMWTFDPNVVFTAISFLMRRIISSKRDERGRLETILNSSTPNAVSFKIAFSLTTKLAILMQRQNELEMATNRISYVISNTLEIENVLQTAVEELGSALNAKRAALLLWQDNASPYKRLTGRNSQQGNAKRQRTYTFQQPQRKYRSGRLSGALRTTQETIDASLQPGSLEIPIAYHNKNIGKLLVEDDTPGRIWESEEVLMAKTISDQLAVAISHARLFRQMELQAITDPLTGLFNHRYFQMSLEREMKFTDRTGEPLSLVLLDIDDLKRINDRHGHLIGDAAILHIGKTMKQTVREIDICARYGGEEFVIILPRTNCESALSVAERLREAIAAKLLPKIGRVTASLGVASYPDAATDKKELIDKADQAMYLAKSAGKNRVCMVTEEKLRA